MLQLAAITTAGLAGRVSFAADPEAPVLNIDPKPLHELSPWLYMQFMEPLGVTDGSIEASWDHMKNRWRPDLIEATKALAPPMMRWGGLFSAYYRWREGIGPRERRKPMHNLVWGGVETNQVGTAEFVDFCRQVKADRMAMAPEPQRQLAGRLTAGVEMLVEPSLGRAVDTAQAPVYLHHLLGMAGFLIGMAVAVFRRIIRESG